MAHFCARECLQYDLVPHKWNLFCLVGQLDKDDLSTKLGQLARKIEDVKVEVHDALMKKYAEFYPLFDATVQLQSRVTDLRSEIDSTLAVIEKQVHIVF